MSETGSTKVKKVKKLVKKTSSSTIGGTDGGTGGITTETTTVTTTTTNSTNGNEETIGVEESKRIEEFYEEKMFCHHCDDSLAGHRCATRRPSLLHQMLRECLRQQLR